MTPPLEKTFGWRSLLFFGLAVLGCLALLGIRILVTGKLYQVFLAWNLFLALIPFLIALAADRLIRMAPTFGAIIFLLTGSVLWLLFFPNSSYIFTDFIHLIQRGLPEDNPNARGFSNMLVWYDVILRSLYAFSGHLTGLASLYVMHTLWTRQFGRFWGWFFVLTSSVAAAYGVFLGRFIRLNSWNLITHPDTAWNALVNNINAVDAAIFTVAFSFFLVISYFFLYIFKKHLNDGKETV